LVEKFKVNKLIARIDRCQFQSADSTIGIDQNLYYFRGSINKLTHASRHLLFFKEIHGKSSIRKILLLLFLFVLSSSLYSTVFAQQKDFEGIMTYKIEIQSKSDLISNRAIMNMLATGNTMTIAIKHGNYRQTSGITDSYFISKDQKVYLRFKGVDTLYFLDYNSDTTAVTQVSKSDEKRNLVGVECKLLIVKLGSIIRKYYYAPSIYMNPDYDKDNAIGRYDVFAKETSSLYLGFEEENKSYSLSENCVRVQPSAVNDSVFDLPALPRKKFSAEELVVQPEFTRNGGWEKYAGANLDGKIAAKYLKIPKGEESVSQQVIVMFLVNENGKVVSAEVINKKEVHPKLAAEALRVVNESPLWKPATFFGGKITYWVKAPITFEVTKQKVFLPYIAAASSKGKNSSPCTGFITCADIDRDHNYREYETLHLLCPDRAKSNMI
jgi:hypothetical protein